MARVLILFLNCFLHIHQVTGIRCVQCLSDVDPGCISNPPPAKICHGKDMLYCIVIEQRTPSGELLHLTRTCSPGDIITEECDDGIAEGGQTIYVCHRVCGTDGCNRGVPSSSRTTLTLFVFTLLSLYMVHLDVNKKFSF
ncbi:uncharacterized protein LOC143258007 [Tachypleus tridentatus]|uniref:uncharacterized protein LOC143258007 n=1 Tax=Tachypleus tridentatus TaxID=6853 RepID=UPI003FD3B7B1